MKIPRPVTLVLVSLVAGLIVFISCGEDDKTPIRKGKPPSSKSLVIIDTDTAISVPTGLDVDDDLAVLFALASPEVTVLGLTVTFGNALISETYPNAVRLMEMAGLTQVPVVRGAGWFTRDLSMLTHASRFLVDTIMASHGEITVVTLGATTNLAAALVQEPRIEEKVKGIIMMGGNLKNGLTDLNFSAHQEATELILGTSIPKVVVPAETCIQTSFTQAEIDKVNKHPESVVYAFRDRLQGFVWLWSVLGEILFADYPDRAHGGFFPWDVVAMAYLTTPGIFDDLSCFSMHMNGPSLESQPCDYLGDHRHRVSVPMKVDPDRFMELMLDRICAIPLAEAATVPGN